MKKAVNTNLKLFFIIFLLNPVFLVHSNELPKDNLFILSQLTAVIVDSVLSKSQLDSSDVVLIQSSNKEDKANWVVENEFVKNIAQRGNDVLIGESTNPKISKVIEFRIIHFGVNYSNTSKKDLIERKIFVSLDVRFFSGQNRKVDLFKNYTGQFVDSVRIAEVEKLELKRYPFTQNKISIKKGFKKYLEPIIIMTTTAGIVYLFFQLRSK
ncbi:hypothetical protein H8E88_20305 [candidate division KSB1 bacterium]|nr:hypothetical protein [candidate division KSB1 bacterium]MBL7094495.1 hypothetical protein [candidate division KSB1 bacterium]